MNVLTFLFIKHHWSGMAVHWTFPSQDKSICGVRVWVNQQSQVWQLSRDYFVCMEYKVTWSLL